MAQTEQISKPKNVSTALRNKFAMFASGKKPRTLAKDNAGVSAVIGVILMVAVTVILAAVIAAFLFGMTPNLISSQGPSPLGFKQVDEKVIITNNGGLTFADPVILVNGYPINPVHTGVAADDAAADTAAASYCSALFDENEYGGTAPTNGAEAAAPLKAVGSSISVNTAGAIGSGASATPVPLTPGMAITITAEVSGNRVVISSYTVQ